jgi:hypothetical protein
MSIDNNVTVKAHSRISEPDLHTPQDFCVIEECIIKARSVYKDNTTRVAGVGGNKRFDLLCARIYIIADACYVSTDEHIDELFLDLS